MCECTEQHTQQQTGQTNVTHALAQGQAGVDLFKTTLLIFYVVFLQDTIKASAARRDIMERKKTNFAILSWKYMKTTKYHIFSSV